jgi:hypothetical protein
VPPHQNMGAPAFKKDADGKNFKSQGDQIEN